MGGFNCADLTVHLRDWATTMSLRGPVISLTPKARRAKLENVYLSFKKTDGICGFWKLWNLEMFYPPKGLCKADTEGGPIVFTYVLFSLRKRILDFHFTSGNPPFWDLQNVLSPEGTSACRLLKEVQLFLLMYYFLLGNVYWTFILQGVIRLFETFKMLYLMGWMGWMGRNIKSVL